MFERFKKRCYHRASSVSGKDKPSPALWLAKQEDKVSLSCPLGITRCILQENVVLIPLRKSFKAREWRYDSDKTRAIKLEWWMILKISLRAKAHGPKTLVKQKFRLYSLYFPQNKLMSTESRGEFSDLHSIFRLRALRYWTPILPCTDYMANRRAENQLRSKIVINSYQKGLTKIWNTLADHPSTPGDWD